MALLSISNIQTVVPMAMTPTTAAAMIKIWSKAPMEGAPAAAFWTGAVARGWAVGAAAVETVLRVAGAAAGAAAGFAAAAGGGAALGAPVGPPGGNVGSLIVGAVDGLGGKLMRTVSFLGWTLPVSFFAGGTAPAGAPGMF